jgi:hypothetical protein
MKPRPAKESEPRPALSGFVIGLAASSLLAAGFAAAWLTLKRPGRVIAQAETLTHEPGGVPPATNSPTRDRWVPPRFVNGAVVAETHKGPRPMRNRAAADSQASTWTETPGRQDATEGTPPTPQVLAQERALRQKLEGLRATHPDVTIRFANCGGGTCVGQVQSSEAAAIDRFASDARRLSPGYQVRVRERLTAFNGRLWEAELVASPEAQTGNP